MGRIQQCSALRNYSWFWGTLWGAGEGAWAGPVKGNPLSGTTCCVGQWNLWASRVGGEAGRPSSGSSLDSSQNPSTPQAARTPLGLPDPSVKASCSPCGFLKPRLRWEMRPASASPARRRTRARRGDGGHARAPPGPLKNVIPGAPSCLPASLPVWTTPRCPPRRHACVYTYIDIFARVWVLCLPDPGGPFYRACASVSDAGGADSAWN